LTSSTIALLLPVTIALEVGDGAFPGWEVGW